jgi:C-terminal processing protease CtpA/Prc
VALSEVLAAAVKDAGRGLLVGTKTPGQVNQFQRFELKDGSALENHVWSSAYSAGNTIG